MPKSFFEYLAIAGLERIHSQTIAFIFSEHCEAFSPEDKNRIIQKFLPVKIEGEFSEIETFTEYHDIDILITTNLCDIIIENKITSSATKQQLEKYQNIKTPNEKRSYFLLSIIGEKAENWQTITYKQLLEILNTYRDRLEANAHSYFVLEYMQYLENLNAALSEFLANPVEYEFVFKDGAKKKADKNKDDYKEETRQFIALNQLETIFQKCFFEKKISKYLTDNKYEYDVMESHGTALINIYFRREERIQIRDKEHQIYIQLQGESIKFVFAAAGYGYPNSNKEEIKEVIHLFDDLKSENKFGYNRKNRPRSKAYVSLSKTGKKWWLTSQQEEIDSFLKETIDEASNMADTLIEKYKQSSINGGLI